MTIDLTFDGSTACLGRDGWFYLREGRLTSYGDSPEVIVRLYSKTIGDTAPIRLAFTNPEELRTLICGLAKALAQMTTITEKEN